MNNYVFQDDQPLYNQGRSFEYALPMDDHSWSAYQGLVDTMDLNQQRRPATALPSVDSSLLFPYFTDSSKGLRSTSQLLQSEQQGNNVPCTGVQDFEQFSHDANSIWTTEFPKFQRQQLQAGSGVSFPSDLETWLISQSVSLPNEPWDNDPSITMRLESVSSNPSLPMHSHELAQPLPQAYAHGFPTCTTETLPIDQWNDSGSSPTDSWDSEAIGYTSLDFTKMLPHENPVYKSASINSRKDLRCWDHGCQGRAFSSRSNLRRHQREQDARVKLLPCPFCGTNFYRKWTRDQHVARMSCKKSDRYILALEAYLSRLTHDHGLMTSANFHNTAVASQE
ncbi:hypothetical protein AUEXF2481DRAFT_33756 [Aureobasidium subglaciale EXF-2481]|uniref:C2H2-type domain-containing protein n=1 Tax=Aureobasidium subglaciale (strain EXF-2481) TaxID=1043005 RepID=A0A074XYR2_AURSE|nr:uncharacterized protein AUEXF2481DRAFT_33756 [Aureobasidium subglaciale EXF-2481]KAI5201487.1 hypothetical protein E4T38_06079 [Aureobasidium subglaciale]KAI5220129.1 hypothetical protein E4T40_06100 [Aureobasidium subglaciale]KAI5223964.1 hypothetical protein E4T41_05940 [Aureobasidium subglaciale]KAI5260672.1 hypothetical protein E4T46_05834 [Aureobasidium subglaciale]KEQ90668.1 hypothetical protein AUEXF2481DRAFT_33756 [Aureobasidium subglaciale EXF-2481]